jgi:hypothetical protein
MPSCRPTRYSSTSTTIRAWSPRERPASIKALSATLRNVEPPSLNDNLVDFMRSRLALHAGEPGRFSAGSNLMLAGLDGAQQVHRQLASLTAPREDLSPEQQSLALIAECFRLFISRSTICVLPKASACTLRTSRAAEDLCRRHRQGRHPVQGPERHAIDASAPCSM